MRIEKLKNRKSMFTDLDWFYFWRNLQINNRMCLTEKTTTMTAMTIDDKNSLNFNLQCQLKVKCGDRHQYIIFFFWCAFTVHYSITRLLSIHFNQINYEHIYIYIYICLQVIKTIKCYSFHWYVQIIVIVYIWWSMYYIEIVSKLFLTFQSIFIELIDWQYTKKQMIICLSNDTRIVYRL